MASSNDSSVDESPDAPQDSGLDKSFVGKFVSGLFSNTPLSKWFGRDPSKSTVRRRDDDDDYTLQPPSKRTKLPLETNSYNTSLNIRDSSMNVANKTNNVKIFNSFPEPVAGPSGLNTRKLINTFNSASICNSYSNQGIVNGNQDSDSEEDSTSAYSSAPKIENRQKSADNVDNAVSDSVNEENPFNSNSLFSSTTEIGNTRSLFPERSLSPHISSTMNTSLSTRRPTFNASTFGSPNFIDKTLSTRRVLNSPFYSGNTIYGGASAYGRKLGQISDQQKSMRNSVQIKPVNQKPSRENTSLSKTARRILNTLEQYSTPISEAKKIPITPKLSKSDGMLSRYTGANPYLIRNVNKASNKELQVPSIPELIQMKQKQRLQNLTESVRQIATNSKSTLNKQEYKLKTVDDEKTKHTNKMKHSISSVRQKTQPIETVPDVNLPQIPLPITTLPKFDLLIPPPSGITTKENLTKKSPKQTEEIDDVENVEYKFSNPLVIAENLKSIVAINNFKFSEPLSKQPNRTETGQLCKLSENTLVNAITSKNNGEFTSKMVKNDLLDKFKPAANTWECSTCLIRNNTDKTKCAACGTLRNNNNNNNNAQQLVVDNNNKNESQFKLISNKSGNDTLFTADLCDKFKIPSNTAWKCSGCSNHYESNIDKCKACGIIMNKSGLNKPSLFGDKFKPPIDTWECTTCMIRNKNELDKCEACGTPNSVRTIQMNNLDKFKPASGTWECPTCMIRNKDDLTKCVACETSKPGLKATGAMLSTTTPPPPPPPNKTFNFGIPPANNQWGNKKTSLISNKDDTSEAPKENSKKIGFGDAFKLKPGNWECSSCLVRNKNDILICACCGSAKPGSTNDKLQQDNSDDKKSVLTFNFGVNKNEMTQFQFGIPTTSSTSSSGNDNKTTTSSVLNIFAGSTSSVVNVAATTTTTSSSSSFTFGVPNASVQSTQVKEVKSTIVPSTNPLLKPTEKLPDKAEPAPVGFKFGPPTTEIVPSAKPSKVEIPKFEFRQASVNGDLDKPALFGNKKPDQIKPTANLFAPASTTTTTTSAIPTFSFEPKSAVGSSINPANSNCNNMFFKFDSKPAAEQTPTTATTITPKQHGFGEINFTKNNGFGMKRPAFGSEPSSSSSSSLAITTAKATTTTTSKPFVFGNGEPPAKLPTFSFGEQTNEKLVSNTATTFKFGGGSSSSIIATAAATTIPPPPPPPPVVPQSAGFNFSANTMPNFNFSSGTTTITTEKTNVLPQQQQQQQQSSTFNTFSPGIQSAKNGTFNFGSPANNNNQKAVFSFGASEANNATASTSNNTSSQSGFNFGSSAVVVPSGGFNFTGPPSTFNMNDGNAAQVGGSQRKIRKALRRTTHR